MPVVGFSDPSSEEEHRLSARLQEVEMQLETSRAQVRELQKLLQSDQPSTSAASRPGGQLSMTRLLDRFRGLAPAVSSLALVLEDLWTGDTALEAWYLGSRCGLELGHQS